MTDIKPSGEHQYSIYCEKCEKEIEHLNYELSLKVVLDKIELDPLYRICNLCQKCACDLGEMISSFLRGKE